MIIINCGMPKSGTTLLVRYQRDLLASLDQANGMEEILKHTHGGFIPVIDIAVGEMLKDIHQSYGSFVVKTHTAPTRSIVNLIESGIAKATFSYRDPRDTVLSALDHAERSRKGKDASRSFANLVNIPAAIELANQAIKAYVDWKSFGKAHFVRYETLMDNKIAAIESMNTYFDINANTEQIEKIYQRHERNKQNAWNFNKGTTFRWVSEMKRGDVQLCLEAFGEELQEMGYSATRIDYLPLRIRRRLGPALKFLALP